ncbi:hypothetical protein WOLCODRAFT_137168 [Wolfiporia cocos MD-104 SS10]|uniref:Uncharacterized protein n=1 Tax=Wolfiporia cocos (strain MD-104) TaxID=742152 RepID=A0A2H3JTB1_WOLCO|nr:hypothetical protein WOLCODRAFT_137168 [Wolfiporia cocos MD-104 SS10]
MHKSFRHETECLCLCCVTAYNLTTALHRWRKERTQERFGAAVLDDLRSDLVLPDAVLLRLVQCAKEGKIVSVADIKKETGWKEASLYGSDVLKLILVYFPPEVALESTQISLRALSLG